MLYRTETVSKKIFFVEDEKITLCINEFILEELSGVLQRHKFKSRINECKTSLGELIPGILEISKIFPNIKISPIIKDDPDDDWIVSCALVSESKYIITGDPHLLKLDKFRSIAILTPHKFLSCLKKKVYSHKNFHINPFNAFCAF